MRFFAVWVYLSACNLWERAIGQWYRVLWLRARLLCLILRHTDYRLALAVSEACRWLPFVNRGLRGRAAVARANQHALLGDGPSVDFIRQMRRRQVLELAATYGRNPQLMTEMASCSAQLNQIVAPLHAAGSPVILAPLHMVSDILAGMVGGEVSPGKATVIVSSGAEVYQEQARRQGGVNLDYCSIHDDNRAIAGNLTSALMEAADNQRNIIIFPDITPDYTVTTNRARTAKLPCRLFNRPANVHSGVVRLARALSASVVFYYLYYDRGIKIHIFPPVEAAALPQALPEVIETALRQRPEDWMLWHAHSLFFINE